MSLSRLSSRAMGLVFFLFLLTPLALVVLFSFTDGKMAAFPIPGLSLRWWRVLLADPALGGAALNSLIIGLSSSVLSTLIGLTAAVALVRLSEKAAAGLLSIIALPLMLPGLIIAVSLLSFYTQVGIPLGLTTIVISHLLFTVPCVVIIIHTRLRGFDARIVDSARDLGADPWTAFRTVTLPMLASTLVGASLLALALSLDDLLITYYTSNGLLTLTTFVWAQLRTSITPATNVVGTLMLLVTISGTVVALRLTSFRG